MSELPGTGWQDVGKRGVRQAKAALSLKQQAEIPKGREAQWAEPTGAGTKPVVCEHQAWKEGPDDTLLCEWCGTIASVAEVDALRKAAVEGMMSVQEHGDPIEQPEVF